MNPKKLVIASRESLLAMWQAKHIQGRLKTLYPDCEVEILGMTTRGDQILDKPCRKSAQRPVYQRVGTSLTGRSRRFGGAFD